MTLMEEMIGVLIGGALGSLLRFLFSRWVNELMPKNFPWGILFVNVLGCLAIGFLTGALVGRYELSAFWRAGIFIGFLGGFTTFSSFSMDTIHLVGSQAYLAATTNVLASVFFALLATAIGLLMALAIFS